VVHLPETLKHLREIVASAPRIRALGTGHSFSGIGESAELVSLDRMETDLVVADSGVSVGAGVRYGELAAALQARGLALHNLASLPHISVGGAVATATHGSGSGLGNLATAVSGVELVTSAGEVLEVSRGDPDFGGLVVNLGALGVVTRFTLDVEPAFEIRQQVFEDLPWALLVEHLGEIMAAAYSVSVFTHFGATAEQVWVKSRAGAREEMFGAARARTQRHPVAGMDPVNATPQLGAPGPWHERLPHFRMAFTPSVGDEIQSEYLVPSEQARGALEAVRGLAAAIQPLLYVCEIRVVAADALWMSPQYGRDTIGIHFTWKPERAAVERVLAQVEAALEPFSARPHWGKLFLVDHAAIGARYERLDDFRRLAERLDPRGAFRNAWLERHVLGPA
jgi:alditol oxidase